MKKFTLTPEQKEYISKNVLDTFKTDNKNSAFENLNDTGADVYIEGDYRDIQFTPECREAWNKAFGKHADKFVINSKFLDYIQNRMVEALIDSQSEGCIYDLFTDKSLKVAIADMEREVKASPLLKKALDNKMINAAKDLDRKVNQLKAQFADLGFEVVVLTKKGEEPKAVATAAKKSNKKSLKK